jgi:hypothetical protein
MPSLLLYVPISRSRGLLLRLVAIFTPPPSVGRPVLRRIDKLPDYLRKDVGLPPEVERPPPTHHRVPF